jgi:hypothetical protein
MVIHDAATFPSIALTCRITDILQSEQKSIGKAERNDRLFAALRILKAGFSKGLRSSSAQLTRSPGGKAPRSR